jgi:prepilin-type N-terminal cleavage/methylation domain-containing protein
MRSGFTLVEVLVVTVLAVVVTSMVFVVQQSTSRRSITTDRKRDAMVRAHRAYQAVHALLASSPRFDVATATASSDEEADAFDAPATSHAVTTPRGAMAFEAARGRLRVREAAVDGLGSVTFHPESETLLAFTVDSGPADSARERSQLYGKQYFEAHADRATFKDWAAPEEPEPVVPFAGGFAFPGTCGYRPKGDDEP